MHICRPAGSPGSASRLFCTPPEMESMENLPLIDIHLRSRGESHRVKRNPGLWTVWVWREWAMMRSGRGRGATYRLSRGEEAPLRLIARRPLYTLKGRFGTTCVAVLISAWTLSGDGTQTVASPAAPHDEGAETNLPPQSRAAFIFFKRGHKNFKGAGTRQNIIENIHW